MNYNKCDFCAKEIDDKLVTYKIIEYLGSYSPEQYYDICSECFNKISKTKGVNDKQ